MPWLRLKPFMECISHPYWSVLCYECAYGSTVTLFCLCRFGVDFHGHWGRPGLSADAISRWRLKPSMDCIPHPYWMYTKCFCTLICCGWAHGSTLTLLFLCRFGANYWGYWGRPESLSDIAMPWLRLNPPMFCISHLNNMFFWIDDLSYIWHKQL
jgi:hypothetical protein